MRRVVEIPQVCRNMAILRYHDAKLTWILQQKVDIRWVNMQLFIIRTYGREHVIHSTDTISCYCGIVEMVTE
jgi:hypothetical protein